MLLPDFSECKNFRCRSYKVYASVFDCIDETNVITPVARLLSFKYPMLTENQAFSEYGSKV